MGGWYLKRRLTRGSLESTEEFRLRMNRDGIRTLA